MRQSKLLSLFYVAYWEWLIAGAVGKEFNRKYGLCNSALLWGLEQGFDQSLDDVDLHAEMQAQFTKAGLNRTYPFGEFQYDMDAEYNAMHLRRERIEWVRDHLPKAYKRKYCIQ